MNDITAVHPDNSATPPVHTCPAPETHRFLPALAAIADNTRHAKATHVEIHVTELEYGQWAIAVKDDGCGIKCIEDVTSPGQSAWNDGNDHKGIGLQTLRDFGCTVSTVSDSDNQDWRVQLTPGWHEPFNVQPLGPDSEKAFGTTIELSVYALPLTLRRGATVPLRPGGDFGETEALHDGESPRSLPLELSP